jgi:hypothetical protein
MKTGKNKREVGFVVAVDASEENAKEYQPTCGARIFSI